MTPKQKANYNKMILVLKRISKNYQTTDQLRRNSNNMYGLSYDEALEMAYDNIQTEASLTVKGIRLLK